MYVNISSRILMFNKTKVAIPGADPEGGDWGDRPIIKLTKVTLFTIILYHLENSISD